MTTGQVSRYPELPDSVTMDELVKKWSELIRVLNDRDAQPITPAEIYGRTIEIGGNAMTGVVFVTAGTSIPGAPTPDYWTIYEFQIPRDVGTVLVQDMPISGNLQILTTLPLGTAVDGRTITVLAANSEGHTNTFNLGVQVAPGSGDTIVGAIDGQVTVENSSTIVGSITVGSTVSTRLNYIGGTPIPSSAGGPLRLEARTSAGALGGMVGGTDYTGGTFYAAENSFTNNTTTSVGGSLAVSTVSRATWSPPLNYTFKAFGHKWLFIT